MNSLLVTSLFLSLVAGATGADTLQHPQTKAVTKAAPLGGSSTSRQVTTLRGLQATGQLAQSIQGSPTPTTGPLGPGGVFSPVPAAPAGVGTSSAAGTAPTGAEAPAATDAGQAADAGQSAADSGSSPDSSSPQSSSSATQPDS